MATYRVPVLSTFAWQEPVLDIVTAPAVTTRGTRYLVAATGATGDFTGKENQIAWFEGIGAAGSVNGWMFDDPGDGWQVYVQDENTVYTFKDTEWTSGGILDSLVLNGDVDSSNVDPGGIDWDLLDNDATALTFMTADEIPLLNLNTTNDAEAVEVTGDLKVTGAIDLSGGAIDVELASASDALTITGDTTSALTINGITDEATFGSDVVVNGDLLVKGNTTTISTQEMLVTDPTITLNDGATAGGAIGVGLEYELNDAIVGSFKTVAGGFAFDPVDNDNILTINQTAVSTLEMGGDLTVESAAIVDQDLTQDSATVQFAGLTLTGDVDLTGQATNIDLAAATANALNVASGLLTVSTDTNKVATTGGVDITGDLKVDGNLDLSNNASTMTLVDNNSAAFSFDAADAAGMLVFDTRDGAERVAMGYDLDVTGDASAANFTTTGDINVDAASVFSDGTNSATAAQMQTSYDTRAQYDNDLHVMRFVDPDVYVPA